MQQVVGEPPGNPGRLSNQEPAVSLVVSMTESLLHDRYDIVIIGAGPAGLNAGLRITASTGSVSMLLVDKTAPGTTPISCAEGVGRLGFEESVDIQQHWIRLLISKACFHAPDGSTITYTDKNKGYIIDRARMQSEMAGWIKAKGVDCHFDRRVTNVSPPGEHGLRTVVFADGSSTEARIVIDASGPVAGLGRSERICWKPGDLEPACFVVARRLTFPLDTVQIFAGQGVAPGGYAWLFPRSEHEANIGIVIGSMFRGKANIRALLEAFLADNYPDAEIIQRFAGAIPCGFQRGTVALPGFIKTGDAASTINPISRAGIAEALLSGALAGEHALQMLGAESEKQLRKICREYETAWYKKRGYRHLKLSRVKQSMLSVPDEDYNKSARVLSKIPQEELTMSKIFRASLGRFPRLVWAMRHLM